ncbi:MAG TPA: hypothetical protein VNF99_05155 [Stellaceae bacterium]|nr:hypothetical protein [Stellaceae bacterium]
MTEKPTEKSKGMPHRGATGAHAAEVREARLAAALRANLHRRKAQARERDAPAPDAKKP